MKKLIALGAIAIAAISLASCSSGGGNYTPPAGGGGGYVAPAK